MEENGKSYKERGRELKASNVVCHTSNKHAIIWSLNTSHRAAKKNGKMYHRTEREFKEACNWESHSNNKHAVITWSNASHRAAKKNGKKVIKEYWESSREPFLTSIGEPLWMRRDLPQKRFSNTEILFYLHEILILNTMRWKLKFETEKDRGIEEGWRLE